MLRTTSLFWLAPLRAACCSIQVFRSGGNLTRIANFFARLEHGFSQLESGFRWVDTGRRRRWSEEEKLKIVVENLRGPRQVAATARGYGPSRSLLLRWRFHR
jgi:hypothetical protein